MPTERNVTPEPPVLDYASPRPHARVRLLTPFNIGCLGAMFLLCTLVLPYDIGSGRVIVNPYRVATAVLTVGCVIVYALLRIWTDPGGTPTRRVVLSLSFIVTVVALVLAHESVRGRRRLPPFEMRFEFWQFVVIAAASVLIACAFCWASWLFGKRSDVRV